MPCSRARERSSHTFSTVYAAGLGSSTSFPPLQRVLSSKSDAVSTLTGVFPSTFCDSHLGDSPRKVYINGRHLNKIPLIHINIWTLGSRCFSSADGNSSVDRVLTKRTCSSRYCTVVHLWVTINILSSCRARLTANWLRTARKSDSSFSFFSFATAR